MSKKTGEAVLLLLPQQHLPVVLSLVPDLLFSRRATKFLSPGKTSNAIASSSDPATCPAGGTGEPLTNGHTVESKKND